MCENVRFFSFKLIICKKNAKNMINLEIINLKKGIQVITEENKDELQLFHFPQIKINFDELFEEID